MTTFEIIQNVLFYAALYVLLWNAWFLTVNKGIPNIRTAPAIRKKILEFVRADMDAKQKPPGNYVIIDPGCGNGDFARQLAKEFPAARVIGYDIDKVAYWKANLFKKLSGLKNVEFYNEDLHKADLGQADAIVMFLSWLLMEPIRATLEKKLKPGTLITSNKFPIGGTWEPEHVLDVDTLYLHQKRLYIYHAK